MARKYEEDNNVKTKNESRHAQATMIITLVVIIQLKGKKEKSGFKDQRKSRIGEIVQRNRHTGIFFLFVMTLMLKEKNQIMLGIKTYIFLVTQGYSLVTEH